MIRDDAMIASRNVSLRTALWRPFRCAAQIYASRLACERVRPRLQAHVLVEPRRRALRLRVPVRDHVPAELLRDLVLLEAEFGMVGLKRAPDLALVAPAALLQPRFCKPRCMCTAASALACAAPPRVHASRLSHNAAGSAAGPGPVARTKHLPLLLELHGLAGGEARGPPELVDARRHA